ncbi:MAG: IS110 family transposase [Agriterribacter sp.]
MSKVNNEASQKATMEMEIIHPHAAGIDVGSRSHYVAIGQGKDDVKKFGVYTDDLHRLCEYLQAQGITTIALESTGSYWQPLFVLLQQYELNPLLVNGKYTKNVSGRKTDVQDCQHIQKMHSLGMPEGSFIPDLFTTTLRQYYRHRQTLVESAARYINKMQKALRMTNIRLDAVLRDIMGRSGKDIVEAILAGQRNPRALALLVQPSVKASTKEIEKALSGDWRQEYLFELQHCYELYKFYHQKIDECDKAIETALNRQIQQQQPGHIAAAKVKIKKKKARKNEAGINLQKKAFELSGGVDLTAIDGIGLGFLLCLVAETGLDLKSFPTGKQFSSWLRVAPNVKKTGDKVKSSGTPKGKNRLTHAFMHAANSIGNKKNGDYLTHFFKRICYKKGRPAAIVATARKLAVIVWNMLVKKQPYLPQSTTQYLEHMRKKQIKNIKSKIRQHAITQDELVA